MSSMGWMTAFASDATMGLVGDGTLLGPKQFDMRDSGFYKPSDLPANPPIVFVH